ncbi:MAG: glycosyltransferase [Planctomycetes bacterium]|nr:glycosyltransferase [Planctomycetota bacterium]
MVAEPTPSPALVRGRQLADAGRHEEALAALREHLSGRSDDGRALNDAGAILYALGRFEEAAEHLGRAAALLGDEAGQALWNLAEVRLASGRPADVPPLFGGLRRAGLLTADLVNRTAAALADQGDAAGALEALLGSLRLAPGQQQVLGPLLEHVRGLRPKVAFLSDFEDNKFIKDIYSFISERYEARWLRRGGPREIFAILRWCDIAWLEWCTGQAVAVSRMPKVCRTVVRLHRFEAFRPWPREVRWENIDALVTVGNPSVEEHLRRSVPGIERRTRIVPVPNGVDLARFAFRDRPRGRNLACVGYLSLHKNPMLLVQAFARLHAADPQYRLFFAGSFQDDGILQAYLDDLIRELGLQAAVRFDGWQDDVAAWLEDKHYLVTGSIVEGCPVGVLEAMARGIRPVVHAFPGCSALFPPEYLWRTVDEFCERILAGEYRPAEYREFVAARFSLEDQLARIRDLFLDLERRPVPKPGAAPAARAPT